MTWLLDSSLLIASVLRHHQQHEDANRWLAKEVNDFATCSVTEGSLIRVHMQLATDKSAEAAWQTLLRIRRHPGHIFWDAGFSYEEVQHGTIRGHKQVTDAWLAELARKKEGKVATLDKGFAQIHPDIAVLATIKS